MIEKQELKSFISSNLKDGHFLISVSVSTTNQIQVYVDSMDGVSISECVEYTRMIEAEFDREEEDYELSVSSGGLDLSFTVPQQYEKNLNKDVEVLTTEGKKLEGVLKSYTDTTATIVVEEMVLLEGKKRKQLVKKDLLLDIEDQIKTIKPAFSFKRNKKN
jgi:ribosome maturation factor RimP